MKSDFLCCLILIVFSIEFSFGKQQSKDYNQTTAISNNSTTTYTNIRNGIVFKQDQQQQQQQLDNNKSQMPMSSSSSMKSLSRKKRYVAFPVGSSFSVAFCETLGAIGDPQYSYMSWAINWGLAYDLPNQTWIINNQNQQQMPKPVVQRRYRRDLYQKLEVTIDKMGYNGRSCMLRALCESTQYFNRKKLNMVEQLLITILSLPKSKVLPFESNDLMVYDAAHRKGRNKINCVNAYPGCHFSLIELALGEYSKPLNYM